MMVLQYFIYQRGDKTWIQLLVGYLFVSPVYVYQCETRNADKTDDELGHHHLL